MDVSFQFHLFLILAPLVGIFLLGMMAYSWHTWNAAQGDEPFLIVINVFLLGWLLFNSLELLSSSPIRTLKWAQLTYLFIPLTPVAWLAFALHYGQQTQWLRPKRFVWILIIPLIAVVLAQTNSWHSLIWRQIQFVPIDDLLTLQVLEYGMWFWILAAYSYCLILAGILVILRRYFNGSSLFRRQSVTVVIGALIPALTNLVYLLHIIPGLTKDFTAISFSMASAAFGISVYRFRLLDLRPVAREAVVDSMGDPMLALDSQSRIVDVNPAARNLIHTLNPTLNQAALVGSPLSEILTNWETLFTSHGDLNDRQTDMALTLNGQLCHFNLRISALQNYTGGLAGRLMVLRDVTKEVQARQTLQKYTEELEQRNRELDAYAQTVAHDLKAPLVGVVGLSEYLLAFPDDISKEEQQALLIEVVGRGRKMASIVDALLLLSSVRRWEDVALSPLDMGVIVAEVQSRLADQVTASQAQIIGPVSWHAAVGYAPWIEEIWANYLSNGLKFGGQPDLGLAPHLQLGSELLRDPSSQGNTVRFWVRDNGPGIPLDQQEKLFAEFSRMTHTRVEGHGLGLSIVRRIVDRLGGMAGMESTPGQGSTFWFTLPAVIQEEWA